jgi:hypothetical protein
VDQLSLWELNTAIDGWRKANVTETGAKGPTDAEDEALRAKYG